MLKRATWIVAAGALLAATGAQAQDKVGTAGAQFLKVGVSARCVGMGDASAAVADDASALYYNPAAITALEGGEVLVSHIDLYRGAGIGYEFVGAVLPGYVAGGRVGISFQALHTDDIEETTTMAPEGTGRNFRVSEYALAGTYALDLTDKFSAGFSLRLISSYLAKLESLGNESAVDGSGATWGIDIGTIYRTGFRGLNFGMAISNFGPDLKYLIEPTPLPINFKVGLAMDAYRTYGQAVVVAVEGSHPNDNAERANLGAEYTYGDMFALRGGFRLNYDDELWSAGGGLRLSGGSIRIDYAYTALDVLPDVHRYTVAFRF